MTKDKMVKTLSEYFKKEGGPMNLRTYKSKGADVPVKDYLLRRAFGSWSRVLSVVSKRYPVEVVAAPEVKKAPKVEKKAEVKVEDNDVE